MPPKTTACTMTLSEPRIGDIWLAYVAFADHPHTGKVRPVVILDETGRASVITAKVTSAGNYDQSGYLEIPRWEACGLRKPSWVQLNPLFEVNREKLLRDAPIGRLDRETLGLLAKALDEQ